MDTEVFVARQPIVDRAGNEVAYELLFRDASVGEARIGDDFACTSTVVERVLGLFGLDRIIGDSNAFLNCTDEFLFSDVVNLLPPSRFVLEVLEDVSLTPELGQRCDELRKSGFRIALDDVCTTDDSVLKFLPHVDIVKLDWPYLTDGRAMEIANFYKSLGKSVLAEKVESPLEHALAVQSGCELFQGYYFSRPELFKAKRPTTSFTATFHLFDLLNNDASTSLIEGALKQAPALVVQLLLLANSGGRISVRTKPIASIRQALSVVGSRQLMRWCCLVLYGNVTERLNQRDPLVRLVERRGAFMERAAKDMIPGDVRFCDSAYLCGLLSLAHVRLGRDVKDFVADLPVSIDIREAIIERTGRLGQLLTLAEHMESGNLRVAPQLSEQLGLRQMNGAIALII